MKRRRIACAGSSCRSNATPAPRGLPYREHSVAARWDAPPREALQERQALAIKTAERLLLDPHRDHAAQEILAQTRRRLAAEHRLPAPPKRIRRKRADASDLGRNRGHVCHRLAHGYAPDPAAVSDPDAAALPAVIR
jgi:hypothetical protein